MGQFTEQHERSGLGRRSWVRRNDAGELVIDSWAEGVQKYASVTRDADVNAKNGKLSR